MEILAAAVKVKIMDFERKCRFQNKIVKKSYRLR